MDSPAPLFDSLLIERAWPELQVNAYANAVLRMPLVLLEPGSVTLPVVLKFTTLRIFKSHSQGAHLATTASQLGVASRTGWDIAIVRSEHEGPLDQLLLWRMGYSVLMALVQPSSFGLGQWSLCRCLSKRFADSCARQ